MKIEQDFFRKIFLSFCRIFCSVLIIVLTAVSCYFFWEAGSEKMPFRLKRQKQNHAIYLSHYFLADDTYFARNPKEKKNSYRSVEKLEKYFKFLKDKEIKTLYPHMCPATPDGNLPLYDAEQMERVLDAAQKYNIRVLPWVGGVLDDSARIYNPSWRMAFCKNIKLLLKNHPRLAGIHLNVEPLPDGDKEFAAFLKDLKDVLHKKCLSLAAYPPPTRWHPYKSVHWSKEYFRLLARNCDEVSVMMYDTAIRYEKFYIALMKKWAKEILLSLQGSSCKVFFAIPAYDDAGVLYHDPEVENISSALQGCFRALSDEKVPLENLNGFAIYCQWEMTEEKWRQWDFLQEK